MSVKTLQTEGTKKRVEREGKRPPFLLPHAVKHNPALKSFGKRRDQPVSWKKLRYSLLSLRSETPATSDCNILPKLNALIGWTLCLKTLPSLGSAHYLNVKTPPYCSQRGSVVERKPASGKLKGSIPSESGLKEKEKDRHFSFLPIHIKYNAPKCA